MDEDGLGSGSFTTVVDKGLGDPVIGSSVPVDYESWTNVYGAFFLSKIEVKRV